MYVYKVKSININKKVLIKLLELAKIKKNFYKIFYNIINNKNKIYIKNLN